ncbi:alpha/beta-hydrolase [Aspergillus violaceofuscus CBS 115571]|uniref:Alpha/beta-hydrolase n=1 Tax=Aspergillus violaceofuscus (strain CBS 115571) TaxID=1450538 RepID=A0A2V5GPK4_ASPV1|nr:alpha/beta-hydrolase [Aspergillus violaceofuscus CBS 115571]
MAFPYTVTEHVIDSQYIREYPRATTTQDAPLKLCVKKYTPIDNPRPEPGDVTIIAAHGTAFAKELYEPLWEDLHARSKKEGFRIRAIWIADSANQGASGILNENQLGNDPSWLDHSRDLLLMINQFRDQMPRPIMGLGHSVGAAQMIFLSLIHPRLFSSLMLVEPYFVERTLQGSGPLLLRLTINKRDVWPSRAVAVEKSRKALRFWDPRVLDRWARFAYRELPSAVYTQEDATQSPSSSSDTGPAVTLATTKYQEALMYTRANPHRYRELGLPDELNQKHSHEESSPPHDPLLFPDVLGALVPEQNSYRPEPVLAGRLVPHLRPSVLLLSGAESPLCKLGIHERIAKKVGTGFGGSGGMEHGRVRHHLVPKAAHTLPLEKVTATADALEPWIQQEVRRWKEDEQRIAQGWEELPAREKSKYSDEWKEIIGSAANRIIERRSKL